jgi:hypothetical protein
VGGVAQLLERVWQLQVIERRRLAEALEVLPVPKDCGSPLGLVAADALEHPAAVVEAVAEHVDLGVLPGNEIAIHPDPL